MKRYQLNQRITLELAAVQGQPRWFAGKTNRLALYSLRLCGTELNLYVKRDWPEENWAEENWKPDDLIGT